MKLKTVIEKRLKDAGFNAKEGVGSPFFMLGEFANNALRVDVFGIFPELMDKTIKAVNKPIRVDTRNMRHGPAIWRITSAPANLRIPRMTLKLILGTLMIKEMMFVKQ